jgi:hypothetical protein
MNTTTRFALMIAASLASGALLAQSGIRESIFGPTDAVKKQADEVNAKMLGPESYAEGIELYVSASERMEKGRDLDRVRSDIGEAKTHFERSIEATNLAKLTFADALVAREAAQKVEAATYAPREWGRAEESFVAAAAVLEGGDLRRAGDDGVDVVKRYRDAEAKALTGKARAGK